MTDDYRWIKWRTRHSAGRSAWRWEEWPLNSVNTLEKQLQDALEFLEGEHTTRSEHWRGVEGDWDDVVPAEVLRSRIERANLLIARKREDVIRWQNQLTPRGTPVPLKRRRKLQVGL